ncbi:MAG: Gfo/Idh/MocA family protein [Phycisphaerae bacterium]
MGVSIGLVGLGAFGSGFADMFKRHPLVSRVGLCDRERDRVAKFASREDWKDKFSPRDAYYSLEDICRAKFDALVIITQPWLHAPQCQQVMEAGKHVYSAVPIFCVPDGDEILDWCDKLVATVKKTGMHYMLGETTYYRPEAMYCRRRAAAGDFGSFVYSEGEYLHDVDLPSCNLRDVHKARANSKAGQEWEELRRRKYGNDELFGGPMHYPTHSTSGPMCVMKAHAVKVTCHGYRTKTGDPFFGHPKGFSNETALFTMSNGSTMRIMEYREIGSTGRETFRIYGTMASFEDGAWEDKVSRKELTVQEMRDPLPAEVAAAWTDTKTDTVAYGGHGGSHAYLVHEFVDAVAHGRVPAINIYEAVRYMAAGVMAHKSAMKDGQTLNVPDWGDAPA